jgi:RNA recognition motif-containing protein
MKIFIANIPYKLDEAELKQMLTQYGQVESIKLITDKETGKRKGFGFIEMPVTDQAQKAIDALNGKNVYGREIALSQAEKEDSQLKNPHQSLGDKRQQIKKDSNSSNEGEIDGNRW